MWYLLRTVLAVGAFVWRWVSIIRWPDPDREIDGRWFYTQLWRRLTHGATGPMATPWPIARNPVGGFRIGLEYRTAFAFELHAESTGDLLLRANHLDRREQTGDEAFDREVHVYADSGDVVTFLRNHRDACEAVRRAFGSGFHSVSADRRILWAAKRADTAASQTDEQMLSQLLKAFAPLEASGSRRWTLAKLKTTFVEALVAAITGYAIAVVIEMFFVPEDLHVDAYRLLPPAVLILLAAVISFVLLAVALLRGSPGIRDILVRRAGIVALSLPVASLQLASDINTRMDSTTPVVVARSISGRFNRGRYGTRHYVMLSPATRADPMLGPRTQIRVRLSVYERARPGRVMRLTIGRGRLGIPWYRRIDVLALPGAVPPLVRAPLSVSSQ